MTHSQFAKLIGHAWLIVSMFAPSTVLQFTCLGIGCVYIVSGTLRQLRGDA